MRADQMRCLFAMLREAGIGEGRRHDWASGVLLRPVISFSALNEHDLTRLINVLTDERDHGRLCDELGPDEEPCVVDESHVGRGEDHAAQDGSAWLARL